jgi:thioesterase domain-containing protein
MAADYAEQILRQRPTGVIHLLGFSAGGWYAYAVAEALLQRGAPIGMLAVLDTGATTRIHRRLGMVLLLRRLSARFGTHLGSLLRLSKGESRLRYLQGRLQGLNDLLAKNLHVRVGKPLPSPPPSPTTSVRVSDQEKPAGDRFADLLYQTYRPQRLSLRVAIFAPESRLKTLQRVWRFYAREGLSLHPIFADHFDFIQADRVGELAHALEAALEDLEEAES